MGYGSGHQEARHAPCETGEKIQIFDFGNLRFSPVYSRKVENRLKLPSQRHTCYKDLVRPINPIPNVHYTQIQLEDPFEDRVILTLKTKMTLQSN